MPPPAIIFSDMDGTLLHFECWAKGKLIEDDNSNHNNNSSNNSDSKRELRTGTYISTTGSEHACYILPPSTMGKGFISLRTLELVRQLREGGVVFVIVSGARQSTLLERLSCLPICDTYVAESGGLIYTSPDCSQYDRAWAKGFERVTGCLDEPLPPHCERSGTLWDLCRMFVAQGFIVDLRSYSTAFRVDLEKTIKQDNSKTRDEWESKFKNITRPIFLKQAGINYAINLGKYDFFPAIGGKGNTVTYIKSLLGASNVTSVALFDDDNDLPMAERVDSCCLIGMRTESVRRAATLNPDWYIAKRDEDGVVAIEEVLERLITLYIN